jgi:RimJ/RimL family protein N-acetyltransferase
MTVDDLDVLYENQLDPEATTMAGFPSRDRETFMAHRARIMADDKNELRTVLVGDEVAGDMNSWLRDGQRLVGYWIGRRFWGRGVATAGLRLFVAELSDRPLYAHVLRTNAGSVRVLEKCGFVRMAESEAEAEAGPAEEDVYVLK